MTFHQGFLNVSLWRHSSGLVQFLQIPLISAGKVGVGFIKIPVFRSRVGLERISQLAQQSASTCIPCLLCAACSPDCTLPASCPPPLLPSPGWGQSNHLCTNSAEGHLGVPSCPDFSNNPPFSSLPFLAFLGTSSCS